MNLRTLTHQKTLQNSAVVQCPPPNRNLPRLVSERKYLVPASFKDQADHSASTLVTNFNCPAAAMFAYTWLIWADGTRKWLTKISACKPRCPVVRFSSIELLLCYPRDFEFLQSNTATRYEYYQPTTINL